jgi:hypothetical protein
MHEYVTTMESRPKIIAYLAFFSVAISIGIGGLLHKLHGFPLAPYVAPPGAITVFAFTFWIYDRLLWRASLFGWRLSPIPDLNGSWTGKVDIRKPDQARTRHKCKVEIRQTWTRISISFETHFTRSTSIMASIGPKEESNGGLRYEYDVTPKPGIRGPEETVARHFGMALLLPVESNWSDLTGEFYNDRSFQRWGVYTMKRNT